MTIAEIAENITQLLWTEADALGRSSGFIQRERKFKGSSYAQMMVCGSLGEPELSYTHLVQYATLSGVQVSAQGIAARFTAAGAEFLAALLETAVQHVIANRLSVALPILAQFTGVYIRDSSVVGLPACLAEKWPGVGNAAGKGAAMKLQVRLNYSTGALDGPALQSGRTHDRQTPYQPGDEPAGSLNLADLGYFSLEEMQTRIDQGQYVLVRYKEGTALYSEAGTRLHLLHYLQQQSEPQVVLPIRVGQRLRLPLRLLAQRVPPAVVEQRRRKLHEYARKKQSTLKAETLALAEWTVVLTNVPATMLTFDGVGVLLHVRWQVELLFKLWKSQLRIDEWRSANPWRILCELYAKLIVAVISQWIFQIHLWRSPDRSLPKAFQVVQKFAVPLAVALRQHSTTLTEILQTISDCACSSAHISKRRDRPPTFQMLATCPSAEGLT